MALVFRSSPEAPAQCALEVATALRNHSEIKVRMGIHSGPVKETADVNPLLLFLNPFCPVSVANDQNCRHIHMLDLRGA